MQWCPPAYRRWLPLQLQARTQRQAGRRWQTRSRRSCWCAGVACECSLVGAAWIGHSLLNSAMVLVQTKHGCQGIGFPSWPQGANVLAGVQAAASLSPEASVASDVTVARSLTASAPGSRSASQNQEVTSAPRGDGEATAAAAATAGTSAGPAVPQAHHGGLAGAGAPTPLSAQQARQDAELEVAVLDCLTDAVLTQCATAPPEMKERLIATVDAGASRPKELSVPQVGGGRGAGTRVGAGWWGSAVCWGCSGKACAFMNHWLVARALQAHTHAEVLAWALYHPCRPPPAATLGTCAYARCTCCAPAAAARWPTLTAACWR